MIPDVAQLLQTMSAQIEALRVELRELKGVGAQSVPVDQAAALLGCDSTKVFELLIVDVSPWQVEER